MRRCSGSWSETGRGTSGGRAAWGGPRRSASTPPRRGFATTGARPPAGHVSDRRVQGRTGTGSNGFSERHQPSAHQPSRRDAHGSHGPDRPSLVRHSTRQVNEMKLTGNYHDATIAKIPIGDSTLTLVVDLNDHWNDGQSIRRTLIFYNVRNIEALGRRFGVDDQDLSPSTIEILEVSRCGPDEYSVDLCPIGSLTILAKGLSEA